MKKHILLFGSILLSMIGTSQVYTGIASSGQVIISPEYSISNSIVNDPDTAYLDLDMDNMNDLMFVVYKGNVPADGINFITVLPMNTIYDLCDSTTQVTFYSYNQLAECSENSSWTNSETNYMGMYGGFIPNGPEALDHQYFIFSNLTTGFVGWVEISFDCNDQELPENPVTLVIHSYLQDLSTQIQEMTSTASQAFPNPLTTTLLHFKNIHAFHSIAIVDVCGKIIPFEILDNTAILPSGLCGTYFIMTTTNGNKSIQKLTILN